MDTPGVIWPKERSVRTDDGARITYTFLGPDDGPVVALTSGLLCPDTWWYHLAPSLAREGHRVLVFHYRGIGSSTLPERDNPDALRVRRYAEDLGAIVAQEQIDELSVVGHSMGTQVALETADLLGEQVRSITLITGGFASPIRTLYDRGEVFTALYWPLRLSLRLLPGPLRTLTWRTLWERVPFLSMGRLARAFGPRTDQAIVRSYVEHAAQLDPLYVLGVFEGMHEHSAEELLGELDVPTLIVAGVKDPFAPLSQKQLMAERISGAVLRTIPHGTHGAILEYPELVDGWVLDFLAEHHPVEARATRSG